MKEFCENQYYKSSDNKLYCKILNELCVSQKYCHQECRYILSENSKSKCIAYKKL
jgi:hypothetical protein